MSDDKNKHRLPFAFLHDIKNLFLQKYSLEYAQSAIAFSLNEDFSEIIRQRMDHYNSGGTIDNIDALKNQIDEVKEGMVQNIEKVLERGEKIELLVDKTDRLNQQAFRFESTSRNLRRHLYWRRVRNIGILSAFVIVVIFILVAQGCGGFDFHLCKKH
jgi:vesicle-associated membrane protein 7